MFVNNTILFGYILLPTKSSCDQKPLRISHLPMGKETLAQSGNNYRSYQLSPGKGTALC